MMWRSRKKIEDEICARWSGGSPNQFLLHSHGTAAGNRMTTGMCFHWHGMIHRCYMWNRSSNIPPDRHGTARPYIQFVRPERDIGHCVEGTDRGENNVHGCCHCHTGPLEKSTLVPARLCCRRLPALDK